MYCLDASVIVNSYNKNEEFHEYSKSLINYIKKEKVQVLLPEIVCPEVASAIARGTQESTIAIEFVQEIRKISNFTFIPIDAELSNEAGKLAAEWKLRGCDAIYTAVTKKYNLKLVTLDNQQKERSCFTIKVVTPEEELKTLGVQ
ncbi:type II toxin-antitoxin system VapC family toxin [bacterium]|nr:type II toxin-antitoxin system VapC family toxin [bacterium]MBU1754377.1 type II toxin-antitoxin system VapC family toxin [bacterium]